MTSFDLALVHEEALSTIESARASGNLPLKYYKIILQTATPAEVLSVVNEIKASRDQQRSKIARRMRSIAVALTTRLGRFANAIDMLAQSLPQAMGLNLGGLVWGGLKFLLVVSANRFQ